jgi:hypothetical protein
LAKTIKKKQVSVNREIKMGPPLLVDVLLTHMEIHALLLYLKYSNFETTKILSSPQATIAAFTVGKVRTILEKHGSFRMELLQIECEALIVLIKYRKTEPNEHFTATIESKLDSGLIKLSAAFLENSGFFLNHTSIVIHEYLASKYN